MAPVSWNGSQVLYQNVIRPCFLRHHQAVDNALGNLSTKALDVASSVTREGNVGSSVPAVPLRVQGRRFSPEPGSAGTRAALVLSTGKRPSLHGRGLCCLSHSPVPPWWQEPGGGFTLSPSL